MLSIEILLEKIMGKV